MLLAGVSCARLDLTWGSLDFHRTSLQNLSAAMRATKRLCAVWIDTVGREIIVRLPSTGDNNGWMVLEKTPIEFKAGAEVVITSNPDAQASPSLLPVNTPSFPLLVAPGQMLHVGRFLATGAEGGSLFLKVVSTTTTDIRCVAQNDASLTGLLTVLVSHREYALTTHAHDLNRDLPLMTEHDVNCIKTFAKEFEIDFVSLSYCNSAEDVASARQTLDSLGLAQTKIIAKVERKAAVHNFDAIINASDGVLLSRGNLGLDFEPEEMALLQKRCVLRCNSLGKPVIVTRFIDTMINTPRPTRAEATDVANAVLDGVDGVMLGAETLRGLYPIDAVKTVVRLCRSAEGYFDYRQHHEEMMGEAFEEEISLQRVYSTTDLGIRGSPSMTNLQPISVGKRTPSTGSMNANGAEATLETTVGSPGHNGPSPTSGGKVSAVSSFGVLPVTKNLSDDNLVKVKESGAPYLSKVESIASSAVRTAEKINAGLVVVLAQTGRTVSLVAKYRPPMPVLAVVVPALKRSTLGWQLEGKFLARQCLIMRGVRPMLAAPMSNSGESLLAEAVSAAHDQGMVKPLDFVVCIMSQQGSLVVKVAQVDGAGAGIRKLGPNECLDHAQGTLPPDPFAGSAVAPFGTPPSPSSGYLRRPSISMPGGGTLGAGNPDVAGVALVNTASDFSEVTTHFGKH